MSDKRDLLVVGAGVLGGLLVKQHKEKFPEAKIVAETRTEAKHAVLRELGADPRTADQSKGAEKATNVVFCVPPGKQDDYAGELNRALGMWTGAPGRFVFTSSSGVYAQDNGEVVTEESVLSDTDRAMRIRPLEDAVLGAGGTVLRLTGLYALDRGAHGAWLKMETVKQRPDGLIGLVSYEDAARAVLDALSCDGEVAGNVFLVCDGKEQTRAQICESALKTDMWRSYKMPEFVGTDGGLGKRFDASKARKVLGWKPRYDSFDAFCDLHK